MRARARVVWRLAAAAAFGATAVLMVIQSRAAPQHAALESVQASSAQRAVVQPTGVQHPGVYPARGPGTHQAAAQGTTGQAALVHRCTGSEVRVSVGPAARATGRPAPPGTPAALTCGPPSVPAPGKAPVSQ